jgi:transcription initiation factor TFIIA large subunit
MQAGQHHPPPTHGYSLPPVHSYVKTEPVERPYVSLAPHPQQMQQYMLPQMKGRPAGQSVLALPRGAPPTRPTTSAQPMPSAKTGTPAGGSGGRIPQLDGPSYSQQPSQATKPSTLQASCLRIPQLDGPASTGSSSDPDSPNSSGSPGKSQQATGEEINSDLDDSDSDNGEGEDIVGSGHAEQDIVFCTYDKVRIRHLVLVTVP